jgi:carbon-monoxide dehydrogenase large subunit
MSSGTALEFASQKVIETGRAAAGAILEAAASDIRFEGGRFTIVGTDRGIGVLELAQRLRSQGGLPADCPTSLDTTYVHDAAPPTYPNGCHIAEVEIDPATGVTRVVKYTMVGDFGVVVNPTIVAGQLYGGVVQGIGQCLMEEARYGDDGQLATGSFLDYAMPRAEVAPWFTFDSLPSPAKTNPLGVKGCGEAGVAGAVTSVMNAIADALRSRGVTEPIDMPATPQKLWSLLRGGA